MIKLVYCFCKREDLTHAEFYDYWIRVHTPIAKRIPGIKKIVRSHAIQAAEQNKKPDFDGMAELWFESLEVIAKSRTSPEWQASTADEANFINPNRVAYFLSEEHEIIPLDARFRAQTI